MTASHFAVGLLLISSVNAFWRLPCAKSIMQGRVDPIVSPGKASGHGHTVMGSNGMSPRINSSAKVDLIGHISLWAQYYVRRLAQLGVLDVPGQGRQVCLLDSRAGT
jgi:hypothetical protein